jgi:hypothetical protein
MKGGLKAERLRLSGRYDAEDADVTDMRASAGDQTLGGGGSRNGRGSPIPLTRGQRLCSARQMKITDVADETRGTKEHWVWARGATASGETRSRRPQLPSMPAATLAPRVRYQISQKKDAKQTRIFKSWRISSDVRSAPPASLIAGLVNILKYDSASTPSYAV